MKNKLKVYIEESFPVKKNDRILLAVSGGMDSVAMLRLFLKLPYETGVAHCNFRLRGKEADKDEKFVRRLAERSGLPCFVQQFDTKEYAEKSGDSIQMAARKLRYEWLEQVREQNNYDWLAVAHHQDDSIETFFINLLRGSGIGGLTGIPLQNGHIIRPMMCFRRKEIATYIKKHKIEYRLDASNKSTKYLRNALRMEILPLLSKIKPGFEEVMLKDMESLRGVREVFEKAVEEKILEVTICDFQKDIIKIAKSGLLKIDPLQPVLFEYLKKFGFNDAVVSDVINGLSKSTHAEYYSATHRIVREKEQLVITKKEKDENEVYLIDNVQDIEGLPVQLSLETMAAGEVKIDPDPASAFVDLDKISFPLELRRWRHGDYFYPFGMNKRKKLSDFFTDEKISVLEKEQTWLLTSSGAIVWIVGKRPDNRFRVDGSSSKILKIRLMVDQDH